MLNCKSWILNNSVNKLYVNKSCNSKNEFYNAKFELKILMWTCDVFS